MLKISKHLINLAFLFILVSTSATGQDFSNPVADLADPYIFNYQGYYYLTGTTGFNVSIQKSRTLEGLKSAPRYVAFSQSNPGGQAGNYWAPEMFRYGGKWYIYYTAPKNSTSLNFADQRMHVLENSASDPTTGTWVYKGRLIPPSADFYAIDHTFFRHNGTNYIIYSGKRTSNFSVGGQNLYIARVSNPWTITSQRSLLTEPISGEGTVNEGAALIRRGNTVSLTYSVEGCTSPNYRLRLATMNAGSNPMLRSSWSIRPGAVFSRNDQVDAFGPGHHGFFKSPDGTEDWFVYHATPEAGGACDNSRTTRAQRIYWNADDTPAFPAPSATGMKLTAPSGEITLPGGSSVANGIYKIRVKISDKMLDVEGASPKNATNVSQYQDTGALNQQWHIQATPEGYYTITSLTGGLALDVINCSMANAANVRMWPPNGGYCQQWSFIDAGDGYYRIVSRQSNKVLDIQDIGQVTQNGANLQQYDWLGGDNQKFKLELVGSTNTSLADGVYRITSKKGGKVLDLNSCDSANGANIHVWNWLNNNCQKWQVSSVGGGFYRIQSESSGKSVDVPFCSSDLGVNIHQWQNYDNDCQKWMIQHVSNGYYKVISKASGLALDVENCSPNAGANVLQYSFWGGDCQLWRFDNISTLKNGVDTLFNEKSISVSPNPSSDVLRVTGLPQKTTTLLIRDLTGRSVRKVETDQLAYDLIIKDLVPGMYIVIASVDGKQITSEKIIKK